MKKNKMLTVLIGTTLMLSVGGASFANQMPRALSTDNRMRIVPYNQNNVVTVQGQEMTTFGKTALALITLGITGSALAAAYPIPPDLPSEGPV